MTLLLIFMMPISFFFNMQMSGDKTNFERRQSFVTSQRTSDFQVERQARVFFLLSTIMCGFLLTFAVGAVILIVKLEMDKWKKDESVCNTTLCHYYSSMLRLSMNPDVKPCIDFYEHVCGGRRKSRSDSVRRQLYRTFRESIRDDLEVLAASHRDSDRAGKKVAVLFETCVDAVARVENIKEDIRDLLDESGIRRPQYLDDSGEVCFDLANTLAGYALVAKYVTHNHRALRLQAPW